MEEGPSAMNTCICCGRIGLESRSGTLVRCGVCETFMRTPRPDSGLAARLLNEYRKRIPEYHEAFDWRVFLLRTQLPGGGRILHSGDACDRFSRVLSEDGYEVETLDQAFASNSTSFYDGIVLWDVLENTADPRVLVERCRQLLKDGGLLLIRVLDSGSVRNRREDGSPPDWGHANYLSQTTLEMLARNVFGVLPLFIQIEQHGQDFLVCLLHKGNRELLQPSRRILMAAHGDAYLYLDSAPGPRMRIFKTLLKLREKGLAVDLAVTRQPRVEPYDLLHIFHHAWKTIDHVQQALCAKRHGKPFVLSTVYMDLAEANFAQVAIPKIFNVPLEREREAYLKALADGTLTLSEVPERDSLQVYPGIERDQQALFDLADHLIGLSFTEIRQIGLTLGIQKPFTIVPNCADPTIFHGGDPGSFVEKYGVEDFVISVGHLEVRKNQLMLLYALKDADLPIVLIGNPYRSMPWYYELCRAYASSKVMFIPQLSQQELASAFAAARVHALPSWAEGVSLANVEAAMAGCNVVASNRGGELEYFGNEGFYCSPASVSSIQNAVHLSYRLGDEARRERLQERVIRRFTFEAAAEKTMEAYERTLSEVTYGRQKPSSAGGRPGTDHVHRYQDLSSPQPTG